MKRKTSERKILFYDLYRDMVEDTVKQFPDLKIARFVLNVMKQTQPRVLSNEIVKNAAYLAERASEHQEHISFPGFPRVPLWLEWEEMGIGDSEAMYVAVWIVPALPLDGAVYRCDLITLDKKSKSVLLTEEGWTYRQTGKCGSSLCHKGMQTLEGEDYAVLSTESHDLVTLGCECAQAGILWSNFMYILAHMLRQPPTAITQRTITRAYPLPRDSFKRKAVEHDNARHPYYVEMSLAHHVTVSRTRGGTSDALQPAPRYARVEPRETVEELVSGHWRVLIPGEGKPWKVMKMVYIEPFTRERERKVQESSQTRYVIQP